VAVVGACREKGSISGRVGIINRVGIGGRVGIVSRVGIGGRVGIVSRVGIGASSGKDVFRLSRWPLLLYRALSIVYSGGVGE
jgi:hypothetical protein